MSDFTLGYLLGLIVGEGSFTGDDVSKCLAVKLSGHDPLPLQDLQAVFGGRLYGPYMHGGRYCRVWILRGRELRRAVPTFEKYLPASRKRDQFLAWRDAQRFEDPPAWVTAVRTPLDDDEQPVLPGTWEVP